MVALSHKVDIAFRWEVWPLGCLEAFHVCVEGGRWPLRWR